MARFFVVATRNPGKIAEIRALLGDLPCEFLDRHPNAPAVEETGATFVENAKLKAVQTSVALGLPVLAEDSGIEVDALGGRPGARSARYSGGGDEENNRKLLRELEGVPKARRTCRYRCAAAFASGDEVLFVTEGTFEGVVLREPRGRGGFGYDPLVWVPSLRRSVAELPPEEKNRISHRAVALGEMRERLREWIQASRE
jgi:XTP/dITP diphosphohydrolase